MQTRTKARLGLGAIIAACLVLGTLLAFGRFELRFSEAQLQQRITARLPIEAKDVKVTDVALAVGEKELAVAFRMEGVRLRQKLTLTAAATGAPVYRAGKFYFHASEVHILEFKLGNGNSGARIRDFAERYVDGERKRKALIEAAPKIADWAKGYAARGAVYALDRMPVYRVKNDVKGVLLMSSLESVRVADGKLVAVVSVVRLTLPVFLLFAVLLGAIGLLIALIRHPGWGVIAAPPDASASPQIAERQR